jgi:hypothetical protein
MKFFGEDVCELLQGADPNQTQVSILNRFVGEVLPDVHMLGSFSTSNNVIASLSAGIVVLVGRSPGFSGKIHPAQEVSAPQQLLEVLSLTQHLLFTERSSFAALIARRSANNCRGTRCLS